MAGADSEAVERTLAEPDLHHAWERRYHTAENARFHDRAIDRLIDIAAPPHDARALDIGCGLGLHAVRLARRGLRVCGADFSPAALKRARHNVDSAGLADRIELRRENLLGLSFEDRSFDLVLCWGVLMHIPEVERAVAELCRVVRPGGTAIVGEGNRRSLEDAVRRISGRRAPAPVRTDAGNERWRETSAGPMLDRRADVGWLTRAVEAQDLRARPPIPAQLTEAYTRFPAGSRRAGAIHALNDLWFRRGRGARFATGIFLIAERPAAA